MAWRSANFVSSWLYYVILLRNVWSLCLTMHFKKKSPVLQCLNSSRTASLIFPHLRKKKSVLTEMLPWLKQRTSSYRKCCLYSSVHVCSFQFVCCILDFSFTLLIIAFHNPIDLWAKLPWIFITFNCVKSYL